MIEICRDKLSDKMKEIIYDGFKEHAVEKCGVSLLSESTSFYITNSKKEVLSVIVCSLFWGALHIKYVWTHKNYRKKGYASKLMEEIFAFAKEHNCPFAYVETMNFQAPDFYKKFGFKIELERKGYAKNSSLYYMKKDFN